MWISPIAGVVLYSYVWVGCFGLFIWFRVCGTVLLSGGVGGFSGFGRLVGLLGLAARGCVIWFCFGVACCGLRFCGWFGVGVSWVGWFVLFIWFGVGGFRFGMLVVVYFIMLRVDSVWCFVRRLGWFGVV